MARAASEADRIRKLRLAFELAQQMGCLPGEVAEKQRRRGATVAESPPCASPAPRVIESYPRLAFGPEPEAPLEPFWRRY